jgi:hypothetical protein
MKPISKIFSIYLLVLLLILLANNSFSQVVVTHFNAKWNEPNKTEWVDELKECEVTHVQCPKKIKKNKIKVLPTIIIFKDGEEIYRFEADLSFKMVATREELQEYVNELIEDVY